MILLSGARDGVDAVSVGVAFYTVTKMHHASISEYLVHRLRIGNAEAPQKKALCLGNHCLIRSHDRTPSIRLTEATLCPENHRTLDSLRCQ